MNIFLEQCNIMNDRNLYTSVIQNAELQFLANYIKYKKICIKFALAVSYWDAEERKKLVNGYIQRSDVS